MRKANLFRPESAIPRMSWSPRNLYNLIARSSTGRLVNELNFTKTSMTMYQQRWRSKRMLRGYHGDWIPERRFKRWFLPTSLPSYAPSSLSTVKPLSDADESDHALDSPTPPVKSLFMRDVERRIDTAVFRCCFAHSVYYARSLVLHGKVSLNGNVHRDPGYLLQPGDLISVEPSCVPMLNGHVAKRVQADRERHAVKKSPPEVQESPTPTKENGDASVMTERSEANASAENGMALSESGESAEGAPAAASEDVKPATNTAEHSEERSKSQHSAQNDLPAGVLPFHLPPFAAPFLFVPPYLDVSFRTCSAIYLRHPTLSTSIIRSRNNNRDSKRSSTEVVYRTDIPSPYPAGGDMFGLAWELYVRNAPRVRSDERRTKHIGRYGHNGFEAARAFEQDRRRVAIRRGWGRKRRITLPQQPQAPAHASLTNTSQ